jgi:hypothetical protein
MRLLQQCGGTCSMPMLDQGVPRQHAAQAHSTTHIMCNKRSIFTVHNSNSATVCWLKSCNHVITTHSDTSFQEIASCRGSGELQTEGVCIDCTTWVCFLGSQQQQVQGVLHTACAHLVASKCPTSPQTLRDCAKSTLTWGASYFTKNV